MKTDNIIKLFKLKMQLKEEKAVIDRKIKVVDNLVGALQFMDVAERQIARRNYGFHIAMDTHHRTM